MGEQLRVGPLVRQWRERRRRTQLELSLAAGLSARHLSFIETGRAVPSREMIERLCDELDVPLRARNHLYLGAGYAPVHTERPLRDLGRVRTAVEAVLAGHEPNPAVVVDARWDLLSANRTMSGFLAAVPARLREPRLNMLRATLHPDGLAGQIRNHAQWRRHTLRRVRRQLDRTADPALADLLAELESYPAAADPGELVGDFDADLCTPMLLDTEAGPMSLLYAVTVFGSPRDVTMDEIAVEMFFAADERTRRILAEMSDLTGAEGHSRGDGPAIRRRGAQAR
ncbi:helix-turn-helix domain-containing protein [Nocardia neocaledoniensis]|uniref:helix-turn-helix domain-containing protein n=1 Tax=Nocardia neocaledoniensis TaxID=236511 RepID=UPI0024559F29|nr:helix-turn-helix transcriptional regulator [Nocardia neocaledoniensis]